MSEEPKDPAVRRFKERIAGSNEQGQPLIHAATVILLKDADEGMETLMLRKNSKIAFGGMWVFPGGRIDDEDGAPGDSMEQRARAAAVREAKEETALEVNPAGMVWFSHWTPPAMGNRRFATWFYAAEAPSKEVTIDEGEITESRWITARDAIALQASGEIELAPPTFVTLHYLNQYTDTASALAGLDAAEPRYYATHIAADGDDVVALWEGDAGYETTDASVPGARHRLHLKKGGFVFEDSAIREGK